MIKAGWAEVSITPEKRIALAGQFVERISESVETPITATALAVESGGEQMVICSCDLVSIGANLVRDVRARVRDALPDLDADKIILNATHTHTSHVYDRAGSNRATSGSLTEKSILNGFLPEEKQYRPKVSAKGDDFMDAKESLAFLTDRISEAVMEAWKARRPAKYATGFGRAAVGMCRRACFSDGSARMWGDTNTATFTQLEGGSDSGIEMLFFYDADDKLTGVVANVACPSQVLEHRLFISSDYWGKVKILLREKYGKDLFVLSLCSAAGDQCPRDLIRWVNPETPIDDPNVERSDYIERDADPSMYDVGGTWLIGRRIVNEIDMALDRVKTKRDDAVFRHEKIALDLPLRRVTPKEYAEAVAELERYAAKVVDHVNYDDNAKMYVHTGTILRYREQHTRDIVPVEVHVVRFGDIAIATNPFELFLDYGNQIRARSRARQAILIQLACGSESYLPTEKAEKGSHYSAYVSSGSVGHQGGELLVRKTTEEINRMFR